MTILNAEGIFKIISDLVGKQGVMTTSYST